MVDSSWRSSIKCHRIIRDANKQNLLIDTTSTDNDVKQDLIQRFISQPLYSCTWAQVHNNKDFIALQNTTRNKNIFRIATFKLDKKSNKEASIEVCSRKI